MVKRIAILLSVVFGMLFLPSGLVYAQSHPWMDDPGQLGHYAIGHTSYMLSDAARANRAVYLDVWYPVDSASITISTPPAQYALDPFSMNLPVSTSKEGPMSSEHGPFPLPNARQTSTA